VSDLEAIVGEQVGYALALPGVGHQHGVLRALTIGVGHQPADTE
jgi:hypothetical protein